MRKINVSKITAFFMSAAMLCTLLFSIPALAQNSEAKTVRIGYYPIANYQEKTDRGTYKGFSYDYYMQIQKYTHWNYEFVEAGYAQCLEMLLNGDIDIMSGLTKTPEREKTMLFSKYSTSNTQNKLYASEDSQNLFYESYDTFNGCIVAMMRGMVTNELDLYCAEHNFSLEKKEYDTPLEMSIALKNGDVDMICAASVWTEVPTKIIAHMDKVPLYYAVNSDRPDICNELDNAIGKITDNNPEFFTQMSEKYKINGVSAAATFTRDEMAYINSGHKVYVVMNSDWAPISWYDERKREYKGIFVDVMEKIHSYSGLEFIYCTKKEFDKMAEDNPDIANDMLAILADDSAWAVSHNVLMSNHVVNSSVVMISKRSSHQTQIDQYEKVALPRGFYITWRLEEEYPAEKIVYYDTVEQCLNAVNSGKADAACVNELVSSYYLSKLEYSDLFAMANSKYNENLAFAVNKDSDRPLLGILDKSLLCIGSGELEKIIIENSIAEQRTSVKGLYYSNPVLTVSLILIVLMLTISGVVLSYLLRVKKKRMAAELEKDAETSAARTEFFMMISHELRTPLNAIIGYLNLAQEHCKAGGAEQEYIRRSQNAANQLSHIASDMLDYTRIASDSATIRNEVFDLKKAVQNLEQNIAVAAEKKEIDFHFTVHNFDYEYVVGDSLRIVQIMQNLLSNAVKFTDSGGCVNADITQKKLDGNNLELIFAAKDTGRGMSDTYIEKVCAPFNQRDKAYSRTHGGLGLGLYLTKYYLEAMNGRMEVESKLGEGSCFTLYIPIRHANGDEIIEQKADLSHVRAMIGSINEDESEQLKSTLKRIGIKCDVQSTPKMMLRRIRSRGSGPYAYSLCVIDESMLMEDNTLIDTIAGYDNPPIIFVMTDNMKSVGELSANDKICQVLYKPIFQSVMFNAVIGVFGEYNVEDNSIPDRDFSHICTMIVEDNKINSDILTRILKKADMEVTVCENGQIAVDEFKKSPDSYDIIFMDIQMPVMNGYESTAKIRLSCGKFGEDVPIVAVSANAFPEDIRKSIESGMNEHLSKPIGIKQIYQVIEKYCLKDE